MRILRPRTRCALPALAALAALIAAGPGARPAAAQSVSAWGHNVHGQLGNGGLTTSPPYGIASPAAASGLTNVVAIAGGGYHSLALTADGRVWAWGYNFDGELGNGGFTDSATPAAVSGLTPVVA